MHIGDSHYAKSDAQLTEECWRQTLVFYEGLDHPEAERVRERLERSAHRASAH